LNATGRKQNFRGWKKLAKTFELNVVERPWSRLEWSAGAMAKCSADQMLHWRPQE
jgi:hypothetical protein